MTPRTHTEATARYRLRLLATTDLHGHLLPYDYDWDQPLASVGLARTATLIRAARAEAANSLLLDNGDTLDGTLIAERGRLGGPGPFADCHPVIAAMNHLGYDAATIGNHDLSFGPDWLIGRLAGATFPWISANVVRSLGPTPLDDRPFLPPTVILERELKGGDGGSARIRIGLIGLLPPRTAACELPLQGARLGTRDSLEAAHAWVPELRRQGADFVVALCHAGIGENHGQDRSENAALALAAVDGVDAIIAGHMHEVFPAPGPAPAFGVDRRHGSLGGKPAVMAGFWGSHLGVIDLVLDRTATGRWQVGAFASEARPIITAGGRPVAADTGLRRLLAPCHRATLRQIRHPVGRTTGPLHTYFARITPSPAIDVVHAAQLDWLAEAVRGTELAALPRLSAASPIKSGGPGGPHVFTDIPSGPLMARHISDLYPFPNTISAIRVTGRTLRNWLERAAAQFTHLVPERSDQPLFDPDMPAYNFDTIAGLSYQIDLTAAPRFAGDGTALPGEGRIRGLRIAGTPVEDEAAFLVAASGYRLRGGGNFPGLGPLSDLVGSETPVRDLIVRFAAARADLSRIGPLSDWRLADLPPGTGAWFDTGPAALDHIGALGGLPVTPIGMTDAGFLRFRFGGAANGAAGAPAGAPTEQAACISPAQALSAPLRGWRG